MDRNSTERNRTNRHGRGARAIGFIGMMLARLLFVAAFVLVLAFVVVWLWNWLMPGLFGLGTITYWQAFGLMILARLVLGTLGLGLRGHGWHHRRPWAGHFGHHGYACGGAGHDMDFNNTMKWWHGYKQFWRDEGKDAFEQYMKRSGEKGPKDEPDKK